MVFILSTSVILIFGHAKTIPLIIVIGAAWSNIGNMQDFFDFSRPYTGIAIVKTTSQVQKLL